MNRNAAADSATFRRARPGDRDALLALIEQALSPYGLHLEPEGADADVAALAERYPAEPENARSQMWVVESADGEIVGSGGFSPLHGHPDTCEIRKMYLRPELKGRGLGRRLLTRLEERARAAGYRRAWLETNARLAEAIALYRKFGYAEAAEGECCSRCDIKMAKDL